MFYNKDRRGLGRSNQLTPRLMRFCLPSRLTLFEIKTFVPKRHQRGNKHAHNTKSRLPFLGCGSLPKSNVLGCSNFQKPNVLKLCQPPKACMFQCQTQGQQSTPFSHSPLHLLSFVTYNFLLSFFCICILRLHFS
jgi:hypothetical protein